MAEINTSPWMWIFVALFIVCILVGFFTLVLGFGYSLLGKETIGSRFIKFGAKCNAIGFLSILVAMFNVFLGILVVYWILWHKLRRNKTNLCPCCGTQLVTEQKFKLIKMFGFRRPISCPSCGDNITLSKWPWRSMIVSLFVFSFLVLLKLFKADFGHVWDFIFYVPITLLLIGHFFLKLEDVTSKCCSPSAESGTENGRELRAL